MSATIPAVAGTYVQTVNSSDPAGFAGCFAENAVVDDAGREIRGLAAIKSWGQHDIFDVQVSYEVLNLAEREGETVVTTKVEGNYDKAGLPDPLVMDHRLSIEGGKIARLVIGLAEGESAK